MTDAPTNCNKRLKVAAALPDLGLLWESSVFSFLDVGTLMSTARRVNRQFRQAVTSSLLEVRLPNLIKDDWTHEALIKAEEGISRHVTLTIRVGKHSSDFASRDALIDRAVRTCQSCVDAHNTDGRDFLRFIPNNDNDNNDREEEEEEEEEEDDIQNAEMDELELNDELVRQTFQEKGEVCPNYDGYGWENTLAFTSASKLSEILPETPFSKDIFSIADPEEWMRIEGKDAIVLSQCMKLILQNASLAASKRMSMAMQKCILYHPDFDQAIAFSGTEYCLQFVLDSVGNELPVEFHILGELRSRDYPDGLKLG